MEGTAGEAAVHAGFVGLLKGGGAEGVLAPPLRAQGGAVSEGGLESQAMQKFLPSFARHGLLHENIFLSSHLLINFWSLMIKSESESVSRVRLFATPLTRGHQAPLSMRFTRQEYWSWLPFPSPGDLPDPGIERGSPALQAHSLLSEPQGSRLMIKFSVLKKHQLEM